MTELTRSLLAAAREGLAPDPDVAARVRAKVALAIAAAPVATASAASLPSTPSTPSAPPAPAVAAAPMASAAPTASIIGKLAAVVLVAGAIAVGVHHTTARVEAPVVTVHTTHEDPAEPALVAATHEKTSSASAGQAIALGSSSSRERVSRPHPTDGLVITDEPVSLAREVELIDAAMASLRAHDPAGSLATLKIFARETHGHAQMAEEAAAIEIEALCAQHVDVGDKLDAFDRAWPESAERTRITDACR